MPRDRAAIHEMRLVQMRNMLATLLLSRGTPMLLAGDEFARTQAGNNNPYYQDNEITWINWPRIGPDGRAQAEFVRKLLMIRRALPMPRPLPQGGLRRGNRRQGRDLVEAGRRGDDAGRTGRTATPDASTCCLDGRAQETGIRRVGDDSTLLIITNSRTEVVPFPLPQAVGGSRWIKLLDTGLPTPRKTLGMVLNARMTATVANVPSVTSTSG